MSSERTLLDESRITRRHVLQAFGVLGGSSLVMGAMDAWVPRPPSGRRSRARGTGTRVIVLGAGISGLVVGYELASGATTSRCSRRASG